MNSPSVLPPKNGIFRLAAIFGDQMVLQREKVNPVWGWDRPGQKVRLITAGGEVVSTRAEADGRWKLTLPAMPTGGPQELVIEGSGTRVLHDVLFGEVWLCAGQSNMQFPVVRSDRGEEAAAAANFPRIRLFTVEKRTSRQPLPDLEGCWQTCSPEAVREFSAVGFFFGRRLQDSLDVPIGLIDTSWGGSPIEAWTALEDVDREPVLAPLAANCREFLELSSTEGGMHRAMRDWEKLRDAALADTRGVDEGWAESEFDDSEWRGCPVPGTFDEAAGEMDGALWYRREVQIPSAWAGRDLELHLGVVDDLDHTYWNGQLVGKTGTDTKEYYKHPRIYTVLGSLVKAGTNLLAVRVFDEYLSGGFVSLESDLWLAPSDAGADQRVSLVGLWKIKVEQVIPEKPWAQDQPQSQPEGIFNGMIAPLVPFGIRGVLWYQGENNLGYASRYAIHFPLMIQAWRRRWQSGDFPFLFVQLANFSHRYQHPAGSCWAELRDAQSAALRLPHTAMVTAIDVGVEHDIHPTNKQAVGRRLATVALAKVYGEEIPNFTGPVLDRVENERGKFRIFFNHAEGGLTTTDGFPPRSFELVDQTGKTEWVSARIEGDSIELTPATITDPQKIKYAWAHNPDVNLVNRAGLPAFPFRWGLPSM